MENNDLNRIKYYVDYIYFQIRKYAIQDFISDNFMCSVEPDNFFNNYNNVDIYINQQFNIFYIKEKVIKELIQKKQCTFNTAIVDNKFKLMDNKLAKLNNILQKNNIQKYEQNIAKILLRNNKKYFIELVDWIFFKQFIILQKPIKYIINTGQIIGNIMQNDIISIKCLQQCNIPVLNIINKYNFIFIQKISLAYLLYIIKYNKIPICISESNVEINSISYYNDIFKEDMAKKQLYNKNIYSIKYLEDFQYDFQIK